MDLGRIFILDGIDVLPDGFRVRTHDLYGTLPEMTIQNSGDTVLDTDKLGHETYKLLAMVKLRDHMMTWLPGSRFLPPTSIDGKAIVGLQAKPKTWIVEDKDFLAAYHELHRQVVG